MLIGLFDWDKDRLQPDPEKSQKPDSRDKTGFFL
jgi:hypothetical protein